MPLKSQQRYNKKYAVQHIFDRFFRNQIDKTYLFRNLEHIYLRLSASVKEKPNRIKISNSSFAIWNSLPNSSLFEWLFEWYYGRICVVFASYFALADLAQIPKKVGRRAGKNRKAEKAGRAGRAGRAGKAGKTGKTGKFIK